TSGRIVVNLITKKMVVVSAEVDQDTLITGNFASVIFKNNKLNPQFLLYLFNANSEFQQMKERVFQGQTTIKVLKTKDIEDFQIKLPSVELQKDMGQTYLKMLSVSAKKIQVIEQTKLFTLGLLDKQLKEME